MSNKASQSRRRSEIKILSNWVRAASFSKSFAKKTANLPNAGLQISAEQALLITAV